MAGLSVNEIIDLSVLLLAREERPRVGDLPARLGDLSGQWFTPTTEVVEGRLHALKEAGFVALETHGVPADWRVAITEEGCTHARELSTKAAPGRCAAAMLWYGLRLSLHGLRPAGDRAQTFLDMAAADAGLPAMTPLARELANSRLAAE
jgi:DNA-binding PadR family transcriptional regulator